MGAIKCDKHGGQGFLEMCEHVFHDLQAGIYPEMTNFPPFDIKLCPTCYESLSVSQMPDIEFEEILKMPDEECEPIDRAFTNIYNKIPGRTAMCYKCIEEVRIANT